MAVEQKHSTLLEEAQSRLSQLSPEQLQVAVAILAYLQETEENKATQELSSIPSLAASFHEMEKSKERLEDTDSNLIGEDAEVWQAYLAIEQQWSEVFRRLADS